MESLQSSNGFIDEYSIRYERVQLHAPSPPSVLIVSTVIISLTKLMPTNRVDDRLSYASLHQRRGETSSTIRVSKVSHREMSTQAYRTLLRFFIENFP